MRHRQFCSGLGEPRQITKISGGLQFCQATSCLQSVTSMLMAASVMVFRKRVSLGDLSACEESKLFQNLNNRSGLSNIPLVFGRILCAFTAQKISISMNRYRTVPGLGPSTSKATSTTTCQKCLKKGHYSYECKASVQSRPYISRPSRSQQLQNPKLKPVLAEQKMDMPETT